MSFRGLKEHALRQHGASALMEFNDSSAQEATTAASHDNSVAASENVLVGQSADVTRDVNKVNLQHSFMRFVTNIGSKPGVFKSTLQNITEEMCRFVAGICAVACQKVEKLCSDLNVECND